MSATAAELEGALRAIMDRHDVAGAAAVVTDRTGIVDEHYLGLADRETRRPVTAETQFRVGSITKVFTSLGVLALARAGRLSLSDPVEHHLPTLAITNPWQETDPIRIAHLLEHTAGFTDMSRAEFDHNVEPPIALSAALKFRPVSRTVRWRPGVHNSYSNLGAGIAGRVIEVAGGSSYEGYIRRQVLQPLGMMSANFFPSADQTRRLATGYDRDGRTIIPYWNMIYRPFGGLNLEARDMARFIRVLLGRGELDGERLIPAAALDRIEAPQSTVGSRVGLQYGYGLGIYSHLVDGHVVLGHGGDADGYLAHFAYSKEAGRGYFVVINAFNGRALREMRRPLERAIVPAKRPKPPPSLESEAHERWSGRYRQATWRFGARPERELRVTSDADGLFLGTGSERRRYVAVAPGLYRRPAEPVATLAFAVTNEATILQGRAGNFRRIKSEDEP